MPYNIFILPILTGYIILINFVLFKYKYQRLNSQRLLLSSILAGLIATSVILLIRAIIKSIFNNFETIIYNWLYSFFPIKEVQYLWTSVLTFVVFSSLTFIINWYIIKKKGKAYILAKAIEDEGDEIEQLFKDSAITGELMQITLNNNKVYIGFTDILPEPKKTNYLKITPVMSGYRDSETKELTITTEYFKVLKIYTSDCPKFDIYDIDITLKQDEILTASIYDQNVFNLFNKTKNKKKKTAEK
jgi:hypothetical protein